MSHAERMSAINADLREANRARRGLAEVARLRAALRRVKDEAGTLPQARAIADEALAPGAPAPRRH